MIFYIYVFLSLKQEYEDFDGKKRKEIYTTETGRVHNIEKEGEKER